MSRAVLLTVSVLVACGGSRSTPTPPPTETAPPYRATIRWTGHGVPHVVAGDLDDLAFGQGYAFAKLHVCILADQVVKVRSERARWFGPGPDDRNVDEDFGWLALGIYERAEALRDQVSDQTRAVLRGYAAGYNHHLERTDPDELPAPCRGAGWVRPITETDLLAHGLAINVLASSGAFVDDIGRAAPPGPSRPARGDAPPRPSPASNAWAIGAERSETGGGLLLANPHFPWFGALKFYESHLTVPGDFDAYGATIMGGPLLNIGFNERVAWTHTFSASRRFVLYALDLDDSDPTRYVYDGEVRALETEAYSIEVQRPDGSLEERERTLYRSHHGPVLASGFLPWTEERAFALFDAAEHGVASADQYLAFMRARSVDDIDAALARHHATPFVNTIATDSDGAAFYADASRVPDIPDRAIQMWRTGTAMMPRLKRAWEAGVMILDGSKPAFAWREADAAAAPGAVPYQRAPRLRRRDFVFNANNSYGYTNPAEPLEGHSILYGDARAPLSPRARMNLRLLTETGEGSASGADGRFSAAEIESALLSNRTLTGELLRAEVLGRCERDAAGAEDSSLRAACDALAAWNGRLDLDSTGVAVWRELLGELEPADLRRAGPLWAEPFDPARPIATPNGLSADADVQGWLSAAFDRLREAGIEPGARLGDIQFTVKDDRRIPVHGGDIEGTANKAMLQNGRSTRLPRPDPGRVVNGGTGLTERGYPIDYGTSFLMIVAFTDEGPTARGILAYSASSDPDSPWFADQTRMWSREELRPLRYRRADIEADPELVVERIP